MAIHNGTCMKYHMRAAAGTEWHERQDWERFSGGVLAMQKDSLSILAIPWRAADYAYQPEIAGETNVLLESLEYFMNGR